MELTKHSKEKKEEIRRRKLYIDLLTENEIHQPENFCGNVIKTTRYTL